VVIWNFVELFKRIEVLRVPCVLDEAAMRGRPEATLVLTQTEREELLALARRRKSAQAAALRARIASPRGFASTSSMNPSAMRLDQVN
jgi:hypothetical protein